MNKEKRSVYVALTNLVDCTLCTFCTYGRTIGFCCENGLECTHPLKYRIEDSLGYFGIEPGMDCWGFSRQLKHNELVDSVGIILAHGWNEWVWAKNSDGMLKIAGRFQKY